MPFIFVNLTFQIRHNNEHSMRNITTKPTEEDSLKQLQNTELEEAQHVLELAREEDNELPPGHMLDAEITPPKPTVKNNGESFTYTPPSAEQNQ